MRSTLHESEALGGMGRAQDHRERTDEKDAADTTMMANDPATCHMSPVTRIREEHRDTGNTIKDDEGRRALDDMGRVRDEYERTEEKHATGTINDAFSTRPRR